MSKLTKVDAEIVSSMLDSSGWKATMFQDVEGDRCQKRTMGNYLLMAMTWILKTYKVLRIDVVSYGTL